MVRPVSDGEATITATAQGRTATVAVHVKNAHAPYVWSFRNDVIPVMSKVGCNSGACHGAAAGKNGFKLTLRGYDPDAGLRHADAPIAGPPRIALRAVAQPDAAEAHVRGSAWRRQALRHRFARISRDRGMDRGRRAAAGR